MAAILFRPQCVKIACLFTAPRRPPGSSTLPGRGRCRQECQRIENDLPVGGETKITGKKLT